jgi:hypothetical protein
VSAALTTADLVQLVGAVVNDHVDASTVASQFVPSPRGAGRLLGRGVEPVEQIGRGDP